MKHDHVTLIPARNSETNAITWTMIHDDRFGQGGNYPDIDLEKGHDYTIKFSIIDINNLGIKFDPRVVDPSSKPKAINAIWIVEGSGEPKKEGAYPDQIDQVGIQGAGKQLTVGDKNSGDPVILTYQLNFVGPAQLGTIPSIDPEIRNTGGHGISFASAETVAAVLGLTVLALVGLLWFTQWRSSRTRAEKPGVGGQKPTT